MKHQDQIRLENLYILMALGEGTVTGVAKKAGISRATLSPIVNGKEMSSSIMRKLEMAYEKPFGWMNEDHESETAPLYDQSVLQAAIECIYSAEKITTLYNKLSVEGKAHLMGKLYLLFTDPAARKLNPKSLLTMLGVNDEDKNTSSNRRNKANT